MALLLLTGIGGWAHHAMRESLDQLVSSNLETVLAASVSSVELWMQEERALVRTWAAGLSDEVQARIAGAPGEVVQEEEPLEGQLRSLARLSGHDGVAVVAPDGRILAASSPGARGRQLKPEGLVLLRPAFAGHDHVTLPFRSSALGDQRDASDIVMLSAAPVRDGDGQVIAVLAALVDPDKEFTRILAVARIGDTGETYAFNAQGIMISASRFTTELVRLGLVADAQATTTVLQLSLRDPGRRLEGAPASSEERSRLPFTAMARSALAGDSGVNVSGYRDYRGVEVVGAWRWIPRLGMGVATEADWQEAYRAMRPVTLAFAGLLALLLAVSAAAVFGGYRAHRLSARISRLERLGQYVLESKVGEGGMGVVYRASHAMLQRPTAIKLLKREAASEEAVARFEREVRLTGRLTHPNTIEIYDYGRTPDGLFYYAMEYLDGISLADLIEADGPLPLARAIHVLKHTCLSLEEAHGIGLIHRDIKPPNIMLCVRGLDCDVVKVLDFGLVKDIDDDLDLTRADEVPGTPMYIAPERMRDPSSATPQTDLYALGVVAFGMLTGKPLFDATSANQMVYHAISTPARRVNECVAMPVPDVVDELVERCLAKDPARRPGSVAEVVRILDDVAGAHPWTRADARAWWRDNNRDGSSG